MPRGEVALIVFSDGDKRKSYSQHSSSNTLRSTDRGFGHSNLNYCRVEIVAAFIEAAIFRLRISCGYVLRLFSKPHDAKPSFRISKIADRKARKMPP
jgi:hypothetical protein